MLQYTSYMMLTNILAPQYLMIRKQKAAVDLYSKFDTKHSISQVCQKSSCIITQPNLKHHLKSNLVDECAWQRMNRDLSSCSISLNVLQSSTFFPGYRELSQGRARNLELLTSQFTEKYIPSNLGLYQPEMNKINTAPHVPSGETS